jgi:hypothetical protein
MKRKCSKDDQPDFFDAIFDCFLLFMHFLLALFLKKETIEHKPQPQQSINKSYINLLYEASVDK